MTARTTVLCGCDLTASKPTAATYARIVLDGTCAGRQACLGLTERDLATHTLLIGPSGCGKTNVLAEMLRQVKRSLGPDDAACVFDPKGDFEPLYDQSADALVAIDRGDAWNIAGDIVADGWDDESIALNAREVAQTVFAESIARSSSPFFPKAARDLFADVLGAMAHFSRDDRTFRDQHLHNQAIREFFRTADAEALRSFLSMAPRFAGSLKYLGDGGSDQALGVLAELQEAVGGLFLGNFGEKGAFSPRQHRLHSRAATTFVEYSIAHSSTPAYQVIVDSFIKESLLARRPGGSTYLVIDELRMLPRLLYLENALSFGRSRGVKVIAAIQSMDQLIDVYGPAAAASLASSFQTLVCFRSPGEATRELAKATAGRALKELSYQSADGTVRSELREASAVEDWDLLGLGLGEALVCKPFCDPFRFEFRRYA